MNQSYISARNGIPSSLEDGEAVSSCLIEVDIHEEVDYIAKRVEIGILFTFSLC